MRFDNIFIPKGNGLGWTLNFENPISWLIVLGFTVIITMSLFSRLKQLYYYLKSM